MNSLPAHEPSKVSNPRRCADLAAMAEQEFSAFFRAVTESFGPEQAQLSAEDWLHEIVEMDRLPASAREWQRFTVKIAARLANRVNTSSLSITNA
jgi:hypothetical protein